MISDLELLSCSSLSSNTSILEIGCFHNSSDSVGSVAQLFPISAAEFSRYSGIKVVKPSVTVTHTIIQYIPPVLEENRFSALSRLLIRDARKIFSKFICKFFVRQVFIARNNKVRLLYVTTR